MLTNEARHYIESRGWLKRDYEQIGAFSEKEYVFFPLKAYNDTIVGETGRHLKNKEFIIRLRKKRFGFFLWRGMESDKTLFLVEGIFDVGWLLQYDFHAAAYLSNELNRAQLRAVARFYDKVIILPDQDQAGVDGGRRITRELTKMGVRHVRDFVFQAYKDIGEVFEKTKDKSFMVKQLLILEQGFDDDDKQILKPNKGGVK